LLFVARRTAEKAPQLEGESFQLTGLDRVPPIGQNRPLVIG
jgi:hypothetical protein